MRHDSDEMTNVQDGAVILKQNDYRVSPTQHTSEPLSSVRGSYSANVPRSSLAEVHREFVLHTVEEETEDQIDEKNDKKESGQQEDERRVAENQTHNMSA